MTKKIKKKAGAEPSVLTDPRTNLPIRVTTTVRIKYRKYFDDRYEGRDILYDMDNKVLNDIIAQDFAASADSAVHMFPSNSSDIKSKRREWIEIRQVKTRRAFNFFLSIIRPGSIDIIGATTRYNKPNKPRVFVPRY